MGEEFPMKAFIRTLRLLAIAMFSLANIAALAQQPTAEQLAIFKSLPPEVQKQLLDEMLKEQDQPPSPKSPTETAASPQSGPEAIQPDDVNLRIRPEFDGEVILRAGDSLLVQLEIIEPEIGKLQPSPDETVRMRGLSERVLQGNPYRLTRQGALEMPGLAPIPLAGLTMTEAAQRLKLDPALRGLDATLTLLPLDAQGTDALKPFGYDLFRDEAGRMAPAVQFHDLSPQ